MGKQKRVRFDFFQIFNKNNNRIIDISNLINNIYNQQIKKRTIDYYGEYARLDMINNGYDNLTYFHMSRLRDEGIATSSLNNDDLDDIDLATDQYIAEDINCLFDSSNCVLMIQRNMHSLSISGVIEYLQSMLSKINPNSTIEFEAKFVQDNNILNTAANIDNYRKIILRPATTITNPYNGPLSSITGIFSSLFNSYEGKNVCIEVSAGRSSKDSLDNENTRDVINGFANDNMIFDKFVVVGKSGDAPVETFDLVNRKFVKYRKYSTARNDDSDKKIHLNPAAVETDIVNQYENNYINDITQNIIH